MSPTTVRAQEAPDPVDGVVLPFPIVEWTSVVKADDPVREPTRGRLRELRKKKRISAGVSVYRRGSRGMEGRSTYHSVLAVLAAMSWRDGRDEDAAELERGASRLEEAFGARLEEFLSRNALAGLLSATFFPELMKATALGLEHWRGMTDTLLTAAEVKEFDAGLARLEGISRSGPVAVDLPRRLVEQQSLDRGDFVWVLSRLCGSAAIVELLPAVRVPRVQVDIMWFFDNNVFTDIQGSHHTVGSPAGSDGLTDDERARYVGQFKETVGADLSADDLEGLRADLAADRLPLRRLRPAG